MWQSQQLLLPLLAASCKVWVFLGCMVKMKLYFHLLLHGVVKVHQLRTTSASRFLVSRNPITSNVKKMQTHLLELVYIHKKYSSGNPVHRDSNVAAEWNLYQANHVKYFRISLKDFRTQ